MLHGIMRVYYDCTRLISRIVHNYSQSGSLERGIKYVIAYKQVYGVCKKWYAHAVCPINSQSKESEEICEPKKYIIQSYHKLILVCLHATCIINFSCRFDLIIHFTILRQVLVNIFYYSVLTSSLCVFQRL